MPSSSFIFTLCSQNSKNPSRIKDYETPQGKIYENHIGCSIWCDKHVTTNRLRFFACLFYNFLYIYIFFLLILISLFLYFFCDIKINLHHSKHTEGQLKWYACECGYKNMMSTASPWALTQLLPPQGWQSICLSSFDTHPGIKEKGYRLIMHVYWWS